MYRGTCVWEASSNEYTTIVMMWDTFTIHCIAEMSDITFISIKRGPLGNSLIATAHIVEVN